MMMMIMITANNFDDHDDQLHLITDNLDYKKLQKSKLFQLVKFERLTTF